MQMPHELAKLRTKNAFERFLVPQHDMHANTELPQGGCNFEADEPAAQHDHLRELGWRNVRRRNLGWRMWYGGPWFSTRLVTATKPG